jgi:hypothetical protein
MTNKEKKASTVNHLNTCIAAFRRFGPARTLYSMAAWAEYHATIEFDCLVADYAPQLIYVLDDIKVEYIISKADVRHPACFIACSAEQRKILELSGVHLSFLNR